MNQIHILRVSPNEAKKYLPQDDDILILSDPTPMISPSVSYNSDQGIFRLDRRQPDQSVYRRVVQPQSDVQEEKEETPRINRLVLTSADLSCPIVRTHKNPKDDPGSESKPLSTFFKRVVLPGSIGGLAGTATGVFLLPTISMITCAIIGGLGLTSITSLTQSIWNSFRRDDRLTVETILENEDLNQSDLHDKK